MRVALTALLLSSLAAVGCSHHHQARLRSVELPPPPGPVVEHTGKLWIELRGQTANRQCIDRAGERRLCFDGVADTLGDTISRTLWPSFPRVARKTKGDNVDAGDYLLIVDLGVEALPADETGPGWSAAARGHWQLIRDGLPLAGESVSSRSRSDFAYGHSLGVAASEVVSAVGVHVANVVSQLPETRPIAPVPLPPVASGSRFGPLFGGVKADCESAQSSDDAKRCSMASR